MKCGCVGVKETESCVRQLPLLRNALYCPVILFYVVFFTLHFWGTVFIEKMIVTVANKLQHNSDLTQ